MVLDPAQGSKFAGLRTRTGHKPMKSAGNQRSVICRNKSARVFLGGGGKVAVFWGGPPTSA